LDFKNHKGASAKPELLKKRIDNRPNGTRWFHHPMGVPFSEPPPILTRTSSKQKSHFDRRRVQEGPRADAINCRQGKKWNRHEYSCLLVTRLSLLF